MSTGSFTQGFLLGQLSVVVLIFAFIKFFIFGEAPSSNSSSSSNSGPHLSTLSPRHRRSFTASKADLAGWSDSSASTQTTPRSNGRRGGPSSSQIIRPPLAMTPANILRKTYYNVPHHQPESLDWFNVLIAQTLAQLRADAAADGAILKSLTTILNGPVKPDFLTDIAVTEIALGEDFPIFSNCRVHPIAEDKEGPGRLEARMDVDLSDFITLGIETTLVLNYPRPRTAVLPVALSVSVVRFSGTLSISFLPASSTNGETAFSPGAAGNAANAGPTSTGHSIRTPTTLAFSFLPNYTLSLSTRSLLGARSRLQDIPKIAQLVESRLRAWFEERCVTPKRQQIVIPSLWPRMKNVVDESVVEREDWEERQAASTQGTPSKTRPGTSAREDEIRLGAENGLRHRRMPSGTSRPAGQERGAVFEMTGGMPGMIVG